ncbi:family 16 glycoside hydrolase, partial [Candidatus Zixiibacteriota bacterium]
TVGDQSWENYIFEAEVKGNAGVDKVLVFRVQDAENFYAINLRSDWMGVDEVTFDKMAASTYTADIVTAAYPSENGVWYRLKITCVENTFKVYVDGDLVLEYTDNDNPYYSGGIGLARWTGIDGDCDIAFDKVSVTDPFPHLIFDIATGGAVEEYLTLDGHLEKWDGSAFTVPPGSYLFIEDGYSMMSTSTPLTEQGQFTYTTVNPGDQSGSVLISFFYPLDNGGVRRPNLDPELGRTLPARIDGEQKLLFREIIDQLIWPILPKPLGLDRVIRGPIFDYQPGHFPWPSYQKMTRLVTRGMDIADQTGDALYESVKGVYDHVASAMLTNWKRRDNDKFHNLLVEINESAFEQCSPWPPIIGSYPCLVNIVNTGLGVTEYTWNEFFEIFDGVGDALYQGDFLDEDFHSCYEAFFADLNVAKSVFAWTSNGGFAKSPVQILPMAEDFIERGMPVGWLGACTDPVLDALSSMGVVLEDKIGNVFLITLTSRPDRVIRLIGNSPIDLQITLPDGRVINKDIIEVPNARYIESDWDLDGELEDMILVSGEDIDSIAIDVIPEATSVPTDTYSLMLSYTYLAMDSILADSVAIEDIPAEPYKFVPFENLPPDNFDLITADGSSFDEFPCLLEWNATTDPNPDHTVLYSVVIARQPDFSDSVVIPVGEETSYQFNGGPWFGKFPGVFTVSFYWKVLAYDAWGSTMESAARSFTVDVPCDCTAFCDMDQNGTYDPLDVSYIVNYVYLSLDARPILPNCPGDNGDWNCDAGVDPLDVTWYVQYVYKSLGDGPCDPCEQ